MSGKGSRTAERRSVAAALAEQAAAGGTQDLISALSACLDHVRAEARRAERGRPGQAAQVPAACRQAAGRACAEMLAMADLITGQPARPERQEAGS